MVAHSRNGSTSAGSSPCIVRRSLDDSSGTVSTCDSGSSSLPLPAMRCISCPFGQRRVSIERIASLYLLDRPRQRAADFGDEVHHLHEAVEQLHAGVVHLLRVLFGPLRFPARGDGAQQRQKNGRRREVDFFLDRVLEEHRIGDEGGGEEVLAGEKHDREVEAVADAGLVLLAAERLDVTAQRARVRASASRLRDSSVSFAATL